MYFFSYDELHIITKRISKYKFSQENSISKNKGNWHDNNGFIKKIFENKNLKYK